MGKVTVPILRIHLLGISTSRKFLAGSSEETPIASPLTPVLAINSGKTEEKRVAPNRTKVQAVLKKIKQQARTWNFAYFSFSLARNNNLIETLCDDYLYRVGTTSSTAVDQFF